MNKYKYLAKNTIVFFIGSFTSKILVFLLLPLYTSVLTTSEYAISDLMSTSVNLLNIVLTLMISEAVLRFSIENRYKKSEVLSVGIIFIVVSSIILGFGILVISKLNAIEIFEGYWIKFFLLYLTYSANHLFAGFIRGIEKVKLIAITGVIGTIVTVVLNIVLLVVFKYGINGYITSMIVSNFVICLIYIFFGKIYKYVNIKALNKDLIFEMVRYSAPIVITQVAWWINSAIDRYMVTWLMGTSETGLLSAAHRIPSILTVFTGIFMQAWKLSAIKEYESESSQMFFSKMLNTYNALLVVAGGFVIAFIKPISGLIFKGDFASAWYLVSPFILAFVINGVSAFLGTFYIANKDTKSLMKSTLIGATINIILNYILIKKVGTIGAGIATAISYFVVSRIRIIQVKRKINLHVEFRKLNFSYLLLTILAVFISSGLSSDSKKSLIISIVVLIVLIWLNSKALVELALNTLRAIKNNINKRNLKK